MLIFSSLSNFLSFNLEIFATVRFFGFIEANLTESGSFSYESDSILKQAIEKQLLPSPRQVARQISEPRFAKQKVKWEQFKQTTLSRLQESYGCCPTCSDDLINFVNHVLNTKKPIVKVSKNGAIEWNWPV